jgi:pimeloyl-ACP methyl ester carboxylesterase
VLSEKGVMESFAQDLHEDERKLVHAVQGPTHSSILSTPIKHAAWHTKPSWFVVAQHDRTISPDQEKFTAERMKAKILTVQSSHLAMLAQPQKVADFIISAAASIN